MSIRFQVPYITDLKKVNSIPVSKMNKNLVIPSSANQLVMKLTNSCR